MARPKTPKLNKKAKAQNLPGSIFLEPPSSADLHSDMKAGLIPLIRLGFSFLKGALKGSFRTMLSDPITSGEAAAQIGKESVDALHEFAKLRGKNDSLGRRLWTLVANAILESFATVIDQRRAQFEIPLSSEFTLQFEIQEQIPGRVLVDRKVLSRPHRIITDLSFDSWLIAIFTKSFQVDPRKVPFFLAELRRAFDVAFWSEIQSDVGYYGPVLAHFNSTYVQSAKWAGAEQEHRARLRNYANQPVLGATFFF